MTGSLRFGYLLEFRLAGYGWHQRSEFNASFSTYRFFSGMQVLHALARFEQLINFTGAPYRPDERIAELERHEIESLGIPAGHRWASPAVPTTDTLATDRQVYNARQEPVVGWQRQAIFPTWGTREVMRPFEPGQEGSKAYVFRSLFLVENKHSIRVGDVYWIGKKRAMLQVANVKTYTVATATVGEWNTNVFLEIPLSDLAIFDSYRMYDATGRGQVIAQGTFQGNAVVCGEAAVPLQLLGGDRGGVPQ